MAGMRDEVCEMFELSIDCLLRLMGGMIERLLSVLSPSRSVPCRALVTPRHAHADVPPSYVPWPVVTPQFITLPRQHSFTPTWATAQQQEK